MDKETIVCEALLDTLTGLTITVSEFKILLALRIHGELRMSELTVRAGFNSTHQALISKLVSIRLIDKIRHAASKTINTPVHKYSINPNGLIALKKAIRPTYKQN